MTHPIDKAVVKILCRQDTKLRQAVAKQESGIVPPRGADRHQIEAAINVRKSANVRPAVQMKLQKMIEIDFRVGAQALYQHHFSAGLREIAKYALAGAPHTLLLHHQPVGWSLAKEVDRIVKALFANDGNFLDAEAAQAVTGMLDEALADNIGQRQRYSGEAFTRRRLRRCNHQDCPYIHDCHPGAAARKRMEREGIHAGRRRKRDIGSSALER